MVLGGYVWYFISGEEFFTKFFTFFKNCIKIQLRNLHAKFQDAALSCWKVIIELGGFGDIWLKIWFRQWDLHRILLLLYFNIATKFEYKVSRGYIEPTESYGLVEWFRVDLSEISFQVGSSSPIFLLYFSLYSIKATRLAFKISRDFVKPLESYQLSDIEFGEYEFRWQDLRRF